MHLSDLNTDIEESDERLVPHTSHSVKNGSVRIVLLSSDTGVLYMVLLFWEMLPCHVLTELCMRPGVGDTTLNEIFLFSHLGIILLSCVRFFTPHMH